LPRVWQVELKYIQGIKNVLADALSRLPMAELFLQNEEDEFPLNLVLIAEHQLKDEKLKSALAAQQPGNKKNVRENVELYTHS